MKIIKENMLNEGREIVAVNELSKVIADRLFFHVNKAREIINNNPRIIKTYLESGLSAEDYIQKQIDYYGAKQFSDWFANGMKEKYPNEYKEYEPFMKDRRANESMSNVPEVEDKLRGTIDAVTADAKLDSEKAEEAVEKDTEENRKRVGLDKEFDRKADCAFGAKEQPKPEEAEKELKKIELDESLFDDSILNEETVKAKTVKDIKTGDVVTITGKTDSEVNTNAKKFAQTHGGTSRYDLTDDPESSRDKTLTAEVKEDLNEEADFDNLEDAIDDLNNTNSAILDDLDDLVNAVDQIADETCSDYDREYEVERETESEEELEEDCDDVETFINRDMQNGNAFWIMGYTANAMQECGLSDEIKEMRTRAMSGNYDNLCAVCQEYLDKCNEIHATIDDDYEVEGLEFVTDGIALNEGLSKEALEDMYLGKKIRIGAMINPDSDIDDSRYNGKEGIVKSIDSMGQLHGTWGGLAVIPEVDEFEIIG